MAHEPGITRDSLASIYREGYVNAIEAARRQHDPCDDWEGFVVYLWRALVPAFGLDDTTDPPVAVPHPRDEVDPS